MFELRVNSNPDVVIIPGTNDWCLADDTNITARCMAAGKLDWDYKIWRLPALQELGPFRVVLDVGAYIGDTTRGFLNRGCEVHSFEPYPDVFACLAHNCPEARLYNVMVGDGELSWYAPHAATGVVGNLGGRRIIKDADSLTPSLALDSLTLDRVAFIKIDVEGFEPYVVEGMRNLVARDRPTILIEAGEAPLQRTAGIGMAELKAMIEAMDYDVTMAFGHPTIGCDYLCTPKEKK